MAYILWSMWYEDKLAIEIANADKTVELSKSNIVIIINLCREQKLPVDEIEIKIMPLLLLQYGSMWHYFTT